MKCDYCKKPIGKKEGIYLIGPGLLLHSNCTKLVISGIIKETRIEVAGS